ncbi:OmpA family protein [Benzoatithermus flavus]|uniref:OmpA family protein n=1 Tax=Benzoatithermus flavus TaxID=3108223 RepID=A0ABU8XYY6_9PROT
MRSLLLGASMLALLAAPAYAQQTGGSSSVAPSTQTAPGNYTVYFAFDRATLGPEARRVVAQAADEYKRTGSAQITVTGYTDTSGRASYNQRLSERRAEAVRQELVRLGVPDSQIVATGRDEHDLAVQTGDGVREPRNRRVEIAFAPPAAPPAPEAAPAPVAEQAPPAEPERQPRFTFTVGGLYGHNFGETDGPSGQHETENDMAGLDLTFDVMAGRFGKLTIDQAILKSFNGVNNGLVGRTVLNLGITPLNLMVFRPYLSANFGGVYGAGVQDGLVVGPELGFDINIIRSVPLRAKVAYDYQFRNPGDFHKGILWGGLSLGYRF